VGDGAVIEKADRSRAVSGPESLVASLSQRRSRHVSLLWFSLQRYQIDWSCTTTGVKGHIISATCVPHVIQTETNFSILHVIHALLTLVCHPQRIFNFSKSIYAFYPHHPYYTAVHFVISTFALVSDLLPLIVLIINSFAMVSLRLFIDSDCGESYSEPPFLLLLLINRSSENIIHTYRSFSADYRTLPVNYNSYAKHENTPNLLIVSGSVTTKRAIMMKSSPLNLSLSTISLNTPPWD
jgi:hypothetical protein